ncbi:HAD superfamily hydrolase (TIGR01509 family) [Pedobacter sp. CG_S7]|uniref:HAD family hydrolase n=1 Tax=Pedobacter sp. CG_S7 TaxID=3143930 RepID=UPI0033970082
MKKIKNLIFDYGNVIFEIDFKKAQDALHQLGITDIQDFFSHKKHNNIFNDLETASITPDQFRAEIRNAAKNQTLSDEEINAAWNSLLIGVPPNIHDLLLKVKEKYRTFLLSNSNEIHYDYIMDYLKKEHHMDGMDHLFERAYFSQHLFLRKPNVEIFEQVMRENNINPEETLFIDDSPQHLEGAKKVGLNTLLMDENPKNLEAFLIKHHIL